MAHPVYYVPAGDVLPIFFDTFDGGTGASITMSGLAVTDIEIYKDGSVTQRASDAGYTLLDTDGIDFDGITGIHGFSIDTGDNTDAGFYTTGAWFHVVVSAITVDGQTVSFIAAAFRIMAAESSAGVPKADVSHFGGTAGTFSGGRPEVNTSHIAGSAVSTSTAQIGVNVVQVSGDSAAADNAEAFFDGTGYAGTNNVIPTVTTVTNAVSANVTQISGDTTAADNLEAVLDGTGGVTLVASAFTLTTPITANATQISGDSTAADNLETAFDDTAGAVRWAGIVDQGTAQSATGTTLVLRAAAAFADDELIGATIQITGGSTGVGQSRLITDYVSATDTATVEAWTTTPTGTITYKIYGTAPSAAGGGLDAAGVRAAIGMASANLDTQLSGIQTDTNAIEVDTQDIQSRLPAALVGGRIDANVGAISADSVAADNAEAFFDGTGYAGTNNVIPTVTTVNGLGANVITAAATAADFTTEIQTGLATAADLATVDTVVDAIKAKTDSLTFTVANVVDANIQRINDVTIIGNGQVGTEFSV